jgi:hypothetical protein
MCVEKTLSFVWNDPVVGMETKADPSSQTVEPSSLDLNWIETCAFPSSRKLVFERDDRAAITAEGRYFLQFAIRAWHGHDGAVAVDGVSAGGEVPAAALGALGQLAGGLAQGLLWG